MRLKRDVTLLTRRSDGLGIYSFKYLWSDAVYVGVMAQEVAVLRPDAVARDPLFGFLSVDYSRLGLRPMILPDRETSLPHGVHDLPESALPFPGGEQRDTRPAKLRAA